MLDDFLMGLSPYIQLYGTLFFWSVPASRTHRGEKYECSERHDSKY